MGAGGVALDLTIILTVGKYAVLVAIYAFVLVVFRGIIKQLAAESRRGQEAAVATGMRQRRVSRRRARETVATEPGPAPQPPPEQPAPQAPAEPEPVEEPEPASEPSVEVGIEPPAARYSRIDLLGEDLDEVLEAREEAVAPPDPRPEPTAEPPPAPPEPAAPHLLVLEAGDEALEEGQTIPLSAAVTIGRADENSLHIADRFISSRHALVCLRDGRRILVDRGSTNGTFVNGERVEDEVELSDGDRIALGNTVLEYHAG